MGRDGAGGERCAVGWGWGVQSVCVFLPCSPFLLRDGDCFHPADPFPLTPAGLPLELRPSTPAVHSPLTFCILVIVHDVLQGHHEDVLPGLLKFTLVLPILYAFRLAPGVPGYGFPIFTVIVKEILVIEVGCGLEAGEAIPGLGQPGVEEAQRVRPSSA